MLAGPGSYLLAQDLDLFQATDTVEESAQGSRRASRNQPRVTEPAFTLVGTSRFGEKFYASLLSREGKKVAVEWTRGKVNAIEGYNGFAVASIGSRLVSIRLPDSETCIANEEKGVKCNENYALLSLSNAKPIEGSLVEVISDVVERTTTDSDVSQDESNNNVETATIGNTGVLTRNPFSGELQQAPNLTPEEVAAREERRAQRAEQFRNFEIVRIPDDEIPEGMQRVRTPFGDTLEPAEE